MKFWSLFFALAAAWNIVVGVSMMVTTHQIAASMGLPAGPSGYVIALGGELITIFGIAYAMVAANPAKNRNLVWVGGIGKLGAALLASFYYLASGVPLTIFYFALADIAWALVFFVFLIRGPKPA